MRCNAFRILYILIFAFLSYSFCFSQNATSYLFQSVEHSPDSLELHQEYLQNSEKSDSELENQYEKLMKSHPNNAIIPFALGEYFCNQENPSAKPLLLKAVKLDTTLAKAYFYLSLDAERWGDKEKGRDHLAKAAEIEPNNADYAFYHASSFKKIKPEKYRELSKKVVNQFPNDERAAQTLYWLANETNDTIQKLQYYKKLKDKFPPEEYMWSMSGMNAYFAVLLIKSPDKAVELAQNIIQNSEEDSDNDRWKNQLKLAKSINQAKDMMKAGKAVKAHKILKNTKVLGIISDQTKDYILLLKSQALHNSDETEKAYRKLILEYAKSPKTSLQKELVKYGGHLNKSLEEIDNDIWKIRDTIAEPAKDFNLRNYLTNDTTSLSDFKGKVVLLTYWFPGCGPCRGEFPHFQNVVDKFDNKDLVYLGINIFSDQNEYVKPFLDSTGYTLIPLEGDPDREKGNLDNGRAAPINFLIDKNGKIVYSHFRTGKNNEDNLEHMISSLLKS